MVYGLKRVLGNQIDHYTFNFLGEKKGHILQVVLYVGLFFYGQSYLANQKTLDVNHLINPREKNGEIVM